MATRTTAARSSVKRPWMRPISNNTKAAACLALMLLLLIGSARHPRLALAQRGGGGGDVAPDDSYDYEIVEPTEEEMLSIRELVRRIRAQRQGSPGGANPEIGSNGGGGGPDFEDAPEDEPAAEEDEEPEEEEEEDTDDADTVAPGAALFPAFPFAGVGFAAVPGLGGLGGIGGLGAGLPGAMLGGLMPGFGGFAAPGLGLVSTRRCREDAAAVQASCGAAFGLSVPCCDALEQAVGRGCWCPFAGGGALPGGLFEISDEAVQAVYEDLEVQCGRSFNWPGEDDC